MVMPVTPVTSETESQPVEEYQELGLFSSEVGEEGAETPPAPEPEKQEPAKDPRYEEVSKLTADMLALKAQNEELRKLIESEKEEATDELEIINQIFGPKADERPEHEKQIESLKSELESFKAQQAKMLEELKHAQYAGWISGEVKEIQSSVKALSEELPWVQVVSKLNPKFPDMVLDRRSQMAAAGEYAEYSDLIRKSNDEIRDDFMGMLDKVLSVPGAKQALLEKVGASSANRPAPPAPVTKPSPTLEGSLSALEPTESSFAQDEDAFEAAVKLMMESGYKEE